MQSSVCSACRFYLTGRGARENAILLYHKEGIFELVSKEGNTPKLGDPAKFQWAGRSDKRKVAFADRIVLNKCDLVDEAACAAHARARKLARVAGSARPGRWSRRRFLFFGWLMSWFLFFFARLIPLKRSLVLRAAKGAWGKWIDWLERQDATLAASFCSGGLVSISGKEVDAS